MKILKNNIGTILSVLMLSIVFWLPQNPMRWHNQELYAFIIVSLIISFLISKRFSWILGLNISWILCVGFYYFKMPKFYFGIFADLAQVMFPSVIADALLWLVCAVIIGLWLLADNKKLRNLLDSCEWLFWIDICVMIGRRLWDKEFHRYLGAMDNEAMDGTLLLLLYILSCVRNSRPWFVHILFGIFIFLTDSTTAICGLGLIWITYFIMEYRIKLWLKIVGASGILCGIMGTGIYLLGNHEFWNSNGRTYIWKKTFDYWWKQGNHYFGLGPGSFALYGPGISLQNRQPNTIQTVFIWMHNEYLQVLFELGIIGLVLFLLLHIQMLYMSYKTKLSWLFISVITFSFIELTQMNYRHAPTSLIGVLILVLVLEKNERSKIINFS